MRRALLLVAAARALAPLAQLSRLAARAVSSPTYDDPREGTWGDNPVGGAAERDGSWLPLCDRADLVAALGNLSCAPGLAAELGAAGSASLAVAAGERFSVAVVALEAGGAAVRSCHPLARSCSTVLAGSGDDAAPAPRRRLGAAGDEPADAAPGRRRRDAPRRAAAGDRALVVEVACLPPVEESIALDGGGDDAARGDLAPEAAGASPARRSRGACSRRASRTATSARLGATRARCSTARRAAARRCSRASSARRSARTTTASPSSTGPSSSTSSSASRRRASLFAPAEWARYRLKTDGGAFARRDALGRGNAVPKLNVVVFDEIDAVCRERGSLSGDTTGVRDGVTAQLLACLDGVEDAGNLVVIGTTNRPELLDAALLRPGRLEVKVAVPAPTPRAAGDPRDPRQGLRPFLDAPAAAPRRRGLCAEDLAGFSGAELRDAAWPELAALAPNGATRGAPPDAAAALAFLEERAYAAKDVALPPSPAAAADLARHLWRYLRGS
ncbi:hypothetical protein JL720_2486 [Aureococcus anophagefferens]|nr:hypothetical protein JL720_2486 [Aureococcus anophagefferens]